MFGSFPIIVNDWPPNGVCNSFWEKQRLKNCRANNGFLSGDFEILENWN